MSSKFRWLLVAIVLVAVAAVGYRMLPSRGASDALPGAARAASAAESAPPVSVATVRSIARDMPVLLQATGSVVAVNSVDVRPQIGSVVNKVHFREGQFVKAGELLFTLDSRPDEANVAKAQAQLQKDQAALADAQRQFVRSRELFAQNFISQGAVDTNQALVDGQAASVAADRAALEAARVNLGYSRIVAPISGRAGAVNVFAGSTVQANQTTLVTITQLDPIAVAFSLPQRYLPDVLPALAGGGSVVTVTLPTGGPQIEGRLKFVDNAVDAATGTVRVKATFDNKDQRLWPGGFVNVQLTARTLKDAVVVPQAAVVQGARGKNVYVVGPDGTALQKPVDVVLASGSDAVVTGIVAGERVVVDGRQNLRPGSRVVERALLRPGGASGAAPGPASGAQP
jgi:RND family efflux transporter MFP subunit